MIVVCRESANACLFAGIPSSEFRGFSIWLNAPCLAIVCTILAEVVFSKFNGVHEAPYWAFITTSFHFFELQKLGRVDGVTDEGSFDAGQGVIGGIFWQFPAVDLLTDVRLRLLLLKLG